MSWDCCEGKVFKELAVVDDEAVIDGSDIEL
jgi:hypothetical protein